MSRVALAALAVGAGLAACSPAPRAVSYFKAHPEEAGRVIVDCASGAHRGAECDNVREAKAEIDADARMAEYKKHF